MTLAPRGGKGEIEMLMFRRVNECFAVDPRSKVWGQGEEVAGGRDRKRTAQGVVGNMTERSEIFVTGFRAR